jgi:hypothetical protein
MSYTHTIPVHLYDNPLTEEATDLFARIETNKTLNIGDICKLLTERYHMPIDAEIVEMCVRRFLDQALSCACEGYNVNLDLFSMALHIRGVFKGVNDPYDRKRHQVLLEFLEGSKSRRYIDDNVTLDIKGMADVSGSITEVKDVATGSINTMLTNGGNVIISGLKIKIAGDNPAVGLYVKNLEDNSEANVPMHSIAVNNPKQIIATWTGQFTIGTPVQILVRTQFSTGKYLLKEPRTILFDKTLTITEEK